MRCLAIKRGSIRCDMLDNGSCSRIMMNATSGCYGILLKSFIIARGKDGL